MNFLLHYIIHAFGAGPLIGSIMAFSHIQSNINNTWILFNNEVSKITTKGSDGCLYL